VLGAVVGLEAVDALGRLREVVDIGLADEIEEGGSGSEAWPQS
jgi:hypothetical protein